MRDNEREVGLSIFTEDRRGLLRDVAACLAARDANIDAIHLSGQGWVDLHLDVSQLADVEAAQRDLEAVAGVRSVRLTETSGQIFGSRVIVIGGGAQVSQVVHGAVSEADRHNLRGERISVDTIPLVGEARLAAAVRAVARLPRAKILVLAGSLMGGEVTVAVRELREVGIPVISLNMVGSVPDAADLVVSDPVQAGVLAVMAIASTAAFDLARVRGRRL
jgi:energy-converting hydrogenase B subunit Q